MLFFVEATRREGIYGHSSVPQVTGPLIGNQLKIWVVLSTLCLKRIAAPKGIDPYQLYLWFSEVPKLEASMADSKCLDTAVFLSILKMDYVERMY